MRKISDLTFQRFSCTVRLVIYNPIATTNSCSRQDKSTGMSSKPIVGGQRVRVFL